MKARRRLYGGRCRVTAARSVAGIVLTAAVVACTGSPQGAQPTSSTTSDGRSQHSQPSSTDGAQVQHVWARLAARPVHLPHVAAGATCPVTRRWSSRRTADLRAGVLDQPLLGGGPVYQGVATNLARWHRDVVMQMAHPKHPAFFLPPGWLTNKVLWGVSRGYRGPVLIRGGQVDGPHRMLFYGNGGPEEWYTHGAPELRFPGRYRSPRASEFLVPTTGCYGWQIDGTGFSRVLVFTVVRQTPRIS
jgi:hypothetical protein